MYFLFFFQAEDGIRDHCVTGVQTCALPIYRLILGARSVPEGGHEITTTPDLLAALDLAGAVVTIDAAGCQAEIVRQIRNQGGDYLVTVKGNQPTLHEAIRSAFDQAGEDAFSGCQMVSSVE